MISPNRCQNCVGTHRIREYNGKDYRVSSGDLCWITHQAIRDSEIDAGCENYYDTRAKAWFIDVYCDIESADRNGKRIKFVQDKEPIVRVRDISQQFDEWTDIYWEAMKQLSKRMFLPMNNEGKWISSNIYRCKPRKETEEYKSGIRTITVSFKTTLLLHPHGIGTIC